MIEFLKSLESLTDKDLQIIESLLTQKSLIKGEFLIQEGKVCDEIVFIKSGVLRSFYFNNEGKEITHCIIFENNLMSAFSSYITQTPTLENIQALFNTELLVLHRNELNYLFDSSINWQKTGRILTEIQYVEIEKRIVSFQKQTAKERYENLLINHSNFIKYIPLQYLASYLGITPRHLSRLRKEV
jgi:CRP-like cAMP-binding protein